MLSRSISSENDRLWYLMEARNINVCLWDCNIDLCDNDSLRGKAEGENKILHQINSTKIIVQKFTLNHILSSLIFAQARAGNSTNGIIREKTDKEEAETAYKLIPPPNCIS